METVKLNKKLTNAASKKNVGKLLKQYTIAPAGQGQPFYLTNLDKAQQGLAMVHFSEKEGNTYLRIEGDDGQWYYLNPATSQIFENIQNIDEAAIGNLIPVVFAPQIPDTTISEETLRQVEEAYGEKSTDRYRKAMAHINQGENFVYLAVTSVGVYQE